MPLKSCSLLLEVMKDLDNLLFFQGKIVLLLVEALQVLRDSKSMHEDLASRCGIAELCTGGPTSPIHSIA